MLFAKILCPTDFSPGSRQALRVAVRIAKETDAELVVTHVWHIPAMGFANEATFSPPAMQEMIDGAERELAAAVGEASAAGARRVTGRTLNGTPWSEIVALLEHEAFDLCVIGTHGRTGLARVLLGSVAEKVVRHAPCSVLAARSNGEVQPFTHALVPTDFSESAARALDLAAELVGAGGAVTALHVLELPLTYSGKVPDVDFSRDLDQRAAITLKQATAGIEGKARVTTVSRIGAPGAQILAALDDDPGIDLIVMGSHGRTGIKRAIMGSVAEQTVRHARCPVLVARAPG